MSPPPSSVAVALGALTLWHSILISRGETSVERHINRKEIRRLRELGKVTSWSLANVCLSELLVLARVWSPVGGIIQWPLCFSDAYPLLRESH
jgi:hypothetical protein